MAVTLAQLRAEPWWDREVTPPALDSLGVQLRAALRLPAGAIGIRGDTGHLYGAHRSQEWIRNSRWCTDRRYTVQANLSAAQARHVAALDITPGVWGTADNRAKVAALTRRLVAAGVAGRLPGVWEVIGTFDGRTAVGVDLPEGQRWPASYDHVDHAHLTFDRRRVGDRAVMERVLAVALTDEGDDLMDKAEWLKALAYDDAVPTPANWGSDNKALSLRGAVAELLLRSVNADRRLPDIEQSAKTAAASAQAAGKTLDAQGAALVAQADAIQATADGLEQLAALIKAGAGNTDLAALLARIDTLSDTVHTLTATVTGLAEDVAGFRTEQHTLRARLGEAFDPDETTS